jgi:hypothetical protein
MRQKLSGIFSQKFHYIGKGAQVYAFASEDGQWVLKFFKFKHLKPSLFVSLLPPIGPLKEFKIKNEERKRRKIDGVFRGHQIAFQYDPEHSAIEYIHLSPTVDLQLCVCLVDKLGFEKTLALDPIVFVLQKKGETLRHVLTQLLEKGNVQQASMRANQILDMYVEEYLRGVWDRDHGISHNTGFIGESPFHLDVGKFSFDATLQSPEFYKSDLIHVAYKMESWVQQHYPTCYEDFHREVESHLHTLLSGFSLPTSLSALPSPPAP